MLAVYGSDNIKDVYTEEDFIPADGKYLDPYTKSKVLADLFSIDFRKNLPPYCPLEIISIYPGLITGSFS
jgi:hypothetical protein